jgi:hypothetical protein
VRIPIHRLVFQPTLSRRGKGMRKGLLGCCWHATRTIAIDPRGPRPARTLFHELLHLAHPRWSERRTLAEDRKRWPKLTWKEKAALYQLLGKGAIECSTTGRAGAHARGRTAGARPSRTRAAKSFRSAWGTR